MPDCEADERLDAACRCQYVISRLKLLAPRFRIFTLLTIYLRLFYAIDFADLGRLGSHASAEPIDDAH